MTNHIHLLLTPDRADSLPRTMQSLGRRYVRYVNATHRRTGTLWNTLLGLFVALVVMLPSIHGAAGDADRFSDPPYGATTAEVEAALQDCAGAQTSMNICAWSRYNDTEKALTAATSRLSSLLTASEQKQALAQANEAFKQFRNATCAFDLEAVEGGSMGFSVVYRCRSAYNNRRMRSLTQYAECVTQETSCELPYFLFVYDTSSDGP